MKISSEKKESGNGNSPLGTGRLKGSSDSVPSLTFESYRSNDTSSSSRNGNNDNNNKDSNRDLSPRNEIKTVDTSKDVVSCLKEHPDEHKTPPPQPSPPKKQHVLEGRGGERSVADLISQFENLSSDEDVEVAETKFPRTVLVTETGLTSNNDDDDVKSQVSVLTLPIELQQQEFGRWSTSTTTLQENIRCLSSCQGNDGTQQCRISGKRGNLRTKGMFITLDIGAYLESGWYSGSVFLEHHKCCDDEHYDGGDDDNSGTHAFIPDGVGIIRFCNNDLYIGEIKYGKMHGKGTLVFDSKDETNDNDSEGVLRGDFVDNLFVV